MKIPPPKKIYIDIYRHKKRNKSNLNTHDIFRNTHDTANNIHKFIITHCNKARPVLSVHCNIIYLAF